MIIALIGVTSAIGLVWILTCAAALARGKDRRLVAVARPLPDVARLHSRLARDQRIPRRVRARIWFAIAYNVQPINLVPDFVPVIGLVDNLVVIVWAVRSTARRAGYEALARHWPGTPEGLAALSRAVGLVSPPP